MSHALRMVGQYVEVVDGKDVVLCVSMKLLEGVPLRSIGPIVEALLTDFDAHRDPRQFIERWLADGENRG
jgi:hypothetical protein